MLLTVVLGTQGGELGCFEGDGVAAGLETLGDDQWDQDGESEDGERDGEVHCGKYVYACEESRDANLWPGFRDRGERRPGILCMFEAMRHVHTCGLITSLTESLRGDSIGSRTSTVCSFWWNAIMMCELSYGFIRGGIY